MNTMAAKNGSLQQALAALIQAQATLTQTQAQCLAQEAAFRERMAVLEAEVSRRFLEIMQILSRHEQILQHLPEAIKKKIGFKAK